MDEFQRLDEDLRACRTCEQHLATKHVDPLTSDEPVKPRPIVTGIRQKPVMLIGQAPGITEYRTGKPFQGDAGQGIRGILAECGLSAHRFDELIYTSAVVKCFPGSKKIQNRRRPGFRREDEVPPQRMVENCRPFFLRQIDLANPRLIILLGGFALKAYLRARGRENEEGRLENFVGRSEQWDSRTVLPFPHTSGTSRWLNDPGNRELLDRAKAILRAKMAEVNGAA